MNENVTDTLNQTTALSSGNGTFMPAYQSNYVHQRDVMAKPFHSNTESTLAPTSEFARYFLLGLPARYIARGTISTIFDKNAHEILKKPVNSLLDRLAINRMESQINALLEKHPLKGLNPGATIDQNVIEALMKSDENSGLRNGLNKIMRPWSAGNHVNEAVEWAYKRKDGIKLTSTTKTTLRNASRGHVGNAAYGIVLGVGSLALTSSYANMVYKDIKNLFAESVGFEFDKPADQVSFGDMLKSKNDLVQLTLGNFWKKTAERFITDLPFFASTKFPNIHLADLMIGVKGAQLFGESWRRRNTMFEDLVKLVNDKINPYNGLGQPVTTADIFDLYQHYHYNRKSGPEQTFNTIIERDTKDSVVWAKSEKLFTRMADLMNQTYAYKHPSELDAAGRPVIRANFALPQFMYMLGHDLIDPKEPEKTATYIETANSHGMQAVKQVQRMFEQGATVEDVMARYPIDRALPSNRNMSEKTSPVIQQMQTQPQTRVLEDQRSHEGRAQSLPENMLPAMG